MKIQVKINNYKSKEISNDLNGLQVESLYII